MNNFINSNKNYRYVFINNSFELSQSDFSNKAVFEFLELNFVSTSEMLCCKDMCFVSGRVKINHAAIIVSEPKITLDIFCGLLSLTEF